ncbi:MAG: DUF4270 domain-containing protein [Flavobacteriales bacterium]|nr:DUF4270 domain-containing protein [Flavobacteriales bacterium]
MTFRNTAAFFGLLIILITASCKEPDGIGLDVLPEGEEMSIAWIDTFTIEVRTILYDSVQTSGLSSGTYLIGDFGDPIFGRVQSELFMQFKLPSTSVEFPSDAVVDSIILNLAYVGSYGSTDKLKGTMTFGVFELEDDLRNTSTSDSAYYSTASHAISATPLAVHQFRPDLYADVVSGYDTVPLPPSLSIRLDNSLGTRILQSNNLASNDVFLSEFKGLNIKPVDASMPSGFGSILYFNVANSYSWVRLYYQTSVADSLFVDFLTANTDGVHTAFHHEYGPTAIESAIAGGTVTGAERLYIQSMAGTRMKVELPHLRDLSNLGAVAINKAELVVPLDSSVVAEFGVPNNLQVTVIDSAGNPIFPVDFFEGSDYYGGVYDSDKKQYVFNIARHLQSLLNSPEKEDYGLYITNSGNAVNARRGVFNGPQHPTKPMKLRMTYTIIE